MYRAFPILLIVLALLGSASTAEADLKIVATTPDLASLARDIGGDHAKVTSLALHTQDPHFVDARPHLALALARADMLLVVGMDLEVGWLPTLQTASRNRHIQSGGRGHVDCSGFVSPLEQATQRIERSQGDIHPGGNPHYMFDPRSAVRVARGVATRMGELDPNNRSCFQSNLAIFEKNVHAARHGWERQLSGLRGARVIAYHKSFPYLADWLGFRVVEHIEPRPGIPPNPRHVARVLTAAKQHGVGVVLQESFYPDRTGKLIAARASAKLVRIPAGPDLGAGQGYVDFMGRVVSQLRRGL